MLNWFQKQVLTAHRKQREYWSELSNLQSKSLRKGNNKSVDSLAKSVVLFLTIIFPYFARTQYDRLTRISHKEFI